MTPFWLNSLASAVGSAAGVGLALTIDRWREAARRRRSEVTQLRIALWLVEENLDLGRKAMEGMGDGAAPFFRMNTHLLDVSTAELAKASSDQLLLLKLERFRDQLHQVNEKIRIHGEAIMFQGTPTWDAIKRRDEKLVPSIRSHLSDHVVPAGEELLTPLKARIRELSRQQLPVRPPLVMPEPIRLADGDNT
jgi:hypothetical protein